MVVGAFWCLYDQLVRAEQEKFRRDTHATINPLLQGLIIIVVGLALLPIVTGTVATSQKDANSTATVKGMTTLLPVLYVIVLVVGTIGYIRFKGK
ncbi:MAG: hypothetical protein ACYDBQ_02180 [Thermoplasmatota archaeon]